MIPVVREAAQQAGARLPARAGGHWYYGKAHAITFRTGEGSWYAAYNGDGKVAGGVAVIHSGRRVGIVELSGQPSDDAGYMAGIAAAAINRLTD